MTLDQIVEKMGGKENIGRDIKSPQDYIKASREGKVKIGVIRSLRRNVPLTYKLWSRILDVSESTLQRRLKQERNLNLSESEAAFEVSEIITKGDEVFGDMDDFETWLNSEIQSLGDERPIDLLDSAIGRKQVMNVLNALAHGFYA